jgi:hypothetical protein
MKHIAPAVTKGAYSYEAYRTLISQLLEQNKTTGDNHSEAMLHYTHLNETRMNRLDKKTVLLPETLEAIKAIDHPLIWLTITEAWCGDAAQVVPVFQLMADQNPAITHKLILRDEHLDIIDAYLTNGGRSIPKILILDGNTNAVLAHWGPRPKHVQEMVMRSKAEAQQATNDEERKTKVFEDVKVAVQKWYNKDKTASIQREFLTTLKAAMEVVG